MLRRETVSTPLMRGFLLPDATSERTCIKCGFHGPETQFKFTGSKHRRSNTCKECDRAAQKKRYREKRDAILAAYRANPEPKRRYSRERYHRNLEESRRRGRENAKSARGLASNRKAVSKYAAAHPERVRARHLISVAIQRGMLVRPKVCQALGCACAGPLHAHHSNYTRPLAVDWLCREHHERVHHVGPVRLKASSAARKFARAPSANASRASVA